MRIGRRSRRTCQGAAAVAPDVAHVRALLLHVASAGSLRTSASAEGGAPLVIVDVVAAVAVAVATECFVRTTRRGLESSTPIRFLM